MILTFLLVYVMLTVTQRVAVVGLAGLPIGMAYAMVHLIGIPLTGTGVNPARSLAPALFAGSPALTQVWLFLVAPLVGAVIAAAVHKVTQPAMAAASRPRRGRGSGGGGPQGRAGRLTPEPHDGPEPYDAPGVTRAGHRALRTAATRRPGR